MQLLCHAKLGMFSFCIQLLQICPFMYLTSALPVPLLSRWPRTKQCHYTLQTCVYPTLNMLLSLLEVKERLSRKVVWPYLWDMKHVSMLIKQISFWTALPTCRTGIHAYRDWRLSSKLKLLISVLSVSVVGGSVSLHKTNTNKSNSKQ